MKDIIYWIWLSLACTPGTDMFRKIYERYGSPAAAYAADPDDISEMFPNSNAVERFSDKSLRRSGAILDYCSDAGVSIITYESPEYPEKLKGIDDPPAVIYFKGRKDVFTDGLSVSVVGTRSASDYGRKMAFSIAKDIAAAGGTVVSGMALGIDGVSHAAALAAGAMTVAVLGSGIDVVYPKSHAYLMREIIKNGAVITEYPPGTPPMRHNFPKRNRIISALSDATVVVEGNADSGSIITANYAFKQGRAVYAVPGNADSENSEASTILIRKGAKILTCADDVLRDFEFVYPGKVNVFSLLSEKPLNMERVLYKYRISSDKHHPEPPSDDELSSIEMEKELADAEAAVRQADLDRIVASLTGDESRIYNDIPENGCTYDELVREDIPISAVLRSVSALQIKGLVEIMPGERIKRIT